MQTFTMREADHNFFTVSALDNNPQILYVNHLFPGVLSHVTPYLLNPLEEVEETVRT